MKIKRIELNEPYTVNIDCIDYMGSYVVSMS